MRSRRLTNLVLLVVVVVVVLTGLGSWLAGTPEHRWVVVAHGVAGLLVALLLRWKAPVVASGLRRRRRSRWASVLLGVLVVLALVSGVLHSTGLLVRAGGQLMMWWHVAVGLAALPLLAWHAASHRQRLRRTDLDRRLALRSGGLLLGAGTVWLLGEGAVRAAGLPGARRRFTGSHPQPLPRPTTWLSDQVPEVDPATWTLTLRDADGPRRLRLAALDRLPTTSVRAVIDCTSGWSSEQDWVGVALSDLVRPGSGRSVVVRSVTGYSRRFSPDELPGVVLARTMADRPLLPQLGAPLRLVVPGRRGFWWVKWVDTVEVDDAPPWWQPVLPVQ